jgi:L,D-transpeptidase YcbB
MLISIVLRLTRIGWSIVVIAFMCMAVGQSLPTMQTLLIAGKLDGMRWLNFRDYQGSLREFYEPRGYKPAWIQGASPSPQALSMIDLFRNAWQKGLEPEDYDASRWDDRLQALRNPGGDPAGFDVAMTVCTMRYISDLRVGRISPQHF